MTEILCVFQNLRGPRATVDVVIIPVEATMSDKLLSCHNRPREATEETLENNSRVKEVVGNETDNVAKILRHPIPCPLDLVPIHMLEDQGNPR